MEAIELRSEDAVAAARFRGLLLQDLLPQPVRHEQANCNGT